MINWEEISASLGTECSGSDMGRLAMARILGEQELENAVEWYVAFRPGYEVAGSVLNLIRSDYAMDLCYRIATSNADINRRRSAVDLLRGFAGSRCLPWTKTFLQDEDADVQNWGVSLLDQLLFRGLVEPGDAEAYLVEAEQHPNTDVRRIAGMIREFLSKDLK